VLSLAGFAFVNIVDVVLFGDVYECKIWVVDGTVVAAGRLWREIGSCYAYVGCRTYVSVYFCECAMQRNELNVCG
jgi:hypothetical protein